MCASSFPCRWRRFGLPVFAVVLLCSLLLAACSGQRAAPTAVAADRSVKPSPAATAPLASPSETRPTDTDVPRIVPASPTITFTPPPSPSVVPTRLPSSTPQPTSVPVTPEAVHLTRLTWSPDGKLLAVGSGAGVYLYDTTTWQEVRFIPVNVSIPSSGEDGVDDLAFSSDGARLGAAGRRVQVWRVADGALAYEIQASRQLAASPTEGLWATMGDLYKPGNLRLWRSSDGQLMREISTGVQFLASIAFSPDGQLIATGPMVDGSPTIWRTANGQQVAQLKWGQAEMFGWVDLAFRPNTATAVAVGTDDVLLFWDTGSGGMRLLSGPNSMSSNSVVNRVSYAPDGSSFATSHSAGPGRQGGSVQIWSVDGARGRSWPINAMPHDVAFSPDSALLAATDERMIYIWRLNDGRALTQIQPIWHPGILPTPTSTPLHRGLNLPKDWKEYIRPLSLVGRQRYRLRYPPTWQVVFEGSTGVAFMSPSPSGYDVSSAMIVDLAVGSSQEYYCGPWKAPGDPEALEWIKRSFGLTQHLFGADEVAFVQGGEWPLLVSGPYGEFDVNGSIELRKRGRVRAVRLMTRPEEGKCVDAYLIDEAEDITLGSCIFEADFKN